MENKIEILFDQMKLKEEEKEKYRALRLTEVDVDSKNRIWTFHIDSPSILPIEDYRNFKEKLEEAFQNIKEVELLFHVEQPDATKMKEYYPYVIELLKKEWNYLADNFADSFLYRDGKYGIEVENIAEKRQAEEILGTIRYLFSSFGFSEEIEIMINEEKRKETREAIQTEIQEAEKSLEKRKQEVSIEEKQEGKKPTYRRREQAREEGSVLGHLIADTPMQIKNLIGEDNNITIEGYLFGTEYFESSKSDFKIITLKITDYSDSIYVKVFTRAEEEYKRLVKELKVGKWFKIRGYSKIDTFSGNQLVLNARDINEVEKEVSKREDNAPRKRIELHAHTKMSQMDGVMDEVEYIKQAIAFGHKAAAITDHNGCQAFPHVFNFVKGYNKGKEESEKFRAIYGTEITMIDDTVDIILRGTDASLMDSTYVVFDFETTGFNAGGEDSIIEIGAVKMQNGEILETYDELINPGRALPAKIVEVTNITDDMLVGKDNEENAVKRFVEWVGDLPMVAHNAKFDCSFLEMAYQKYHLGEFKNPVLDTLELSRTMDTNYARHSLSALVKRYDVEFDEDAHHRADYDAKGTALVLYKMLKKLNDNNYETLNDLQKLVSKEEIHKFGNSYHINILAKNKVGLKNMFKIISLANTKYLYKTPRILRSEIERLREGLLIGSGCYESEVFHQARSKSEEELTNIINFYDYVEVQPPEVYDHLVQSGDFASEKEVLETIQKIIDTTISAGKLIVATGDVHHLNEEDKIYREIIINQKVPGGGRHPLNRKNITNIPSQHFRTTEEMLADFSFLKEDIRNLIVIDNPEKILSQIEDIEVIIDTGGIPFSPRIDKSVETVTELVLNRASSWYGDPLPYNIEERIAKELYGDGAMEAVSYLTKEELGENASDLEKETYARLHKTLQEGFDKVKEVMHLFLEKTDSEFASLEKSEQEKIIKKKLGGVIGGGFDVIYLIAQKLVKHSNDDGYLVGSRGSVGSSFVATMMGITEVNPLPAHYLCRNEDCKYSEFENEQNEPYGKEYSSGYDLPDKICPKCGKPLGKEGQDMPFATFLGFNADKVPDIDLNFSGDYQWKAHEYTKVLFGVDNVYRAGTIGTVADKTAFGFVRGYFEDKGIENVRTAEIERLAIGCTGVKRTTGQHPGGIVVIPGYMDVFDFTPFQYPADDDTSLWRTTHFDYHAIDQDVLKLDILGHDDPTVLRMLQDLSGIDVTTLPFDDKKVMSLLSSPDSLGVTEEQIKCPTGTLGLPELGTQFVIGMLVETKPKTFGELVKISGLSHGTDVWAGNASELIANNIVPFKDVIGCRDDIMVNLMNWGMKPIRAFKIMEHVRKGKASKDPETWAGMVEDMKKAGVPDWYINSCYKIKYMFPKAHACAYVMSALRIAWFKVYKPLYYYAAHFSVRIDDFDIEIMNKGYDAIKKKIEDLELKGYDISNKETNILESLKIALEASARGIKFEKVSIEKSDAKNFILAGDDCTLIPPFRTIDGLGGTVATNIVEEREKNPFISIDDLQKRGKLSSTLIDKMRLMGILDDLPESSQMTLF